MKKFYTALKLFEKHHPKVEVVSIRRWTKNSFSVTTKEKKDYNVDISTNKVDESYPDIDFD